MAERQITLSVAQIQSLALKTMGFRPDLEVKVRAPYDDSTHVECDVYHVRNGIDHDGAWQSWGIDADGDATELLDKGIMPKFYEWREH